MLVLYVYISIVLLNKPCLLFLLQVGGIDVEESLSPLSVSLLENSPFTHLARQLEANGQEDTDGKQQEGDKMKFSAQFQDFTRVDMSWYV